LNGDFLVDCDPYLDAKIPFLLPTREGNKDKSELEASFLLLRALPSLFFIIS